MDERPSAAGTAPDTGSAADGTITVTLPNGDRLAVPAGSRMADVAAAIGPRLAKAAIAGVVDDRPVDLSHVLVADARVRILTPRDDEALDIFRHSTSHLMAQAVKELFPDTRIAQGPSIEDGFYYDFGRDEPFTPDDLERIEQRMREIVKQDLEIVRHEVAKDEALRLWEQEAEPYKLYFAREKGGPVVSFYKQGSFNDFCLGPHLPRTGRIGAFKLLRTAAAYWLGDESNETLWRIYGTAYPEQKQLDEHLERLREAERRDHRRLGKELGLFSVHEEAGSGFIFWHPRGAIIRQEIEAHWKAEHQARGYDFVYTPHVARDTLFRTSGHYDYYRENMYTLEADEEEYVLKPMNCPGHIMIYRSGLRSYRDLPLRFTELGTVYRYERSGTLHGLLRVRGFTQDDGHIFCTPEQLGDEVLGVLDLVTDTFRTFGFTDYRFELSVRDPENAEKYAGTDEEWEAAETALSEALAAREFPYKRMEGEAVFYGPKIDVKVIDAIGRSWQLSTIQFDFNLPRRFDIHYIDSASQHRAPYMVHRAIYGSLERFIGILTEHYAGAFPPWLAPVQARILPITDRVLSHCDDVAERCRRAGLRAEVDRRSEKVGAKIRDAQLEKVPYMLVVGDREAQAGQVSLRLRSEGDQGAMSVDDFLDRARTAVGSRAIEP